MTEGRTRAAVADPLAEASAADVQEQRQLVVEDADEGRLGYELPPEVSEADAMEQLRAVPLDDDDWR